MENIVLSLIIGIFGSLIATAVFISVSEFVRKVFIPWYTDKIYRGVRVDGKWKVEELKEKSLEERECYMKFDLCQKGEKVTGYYSHKCNNEVDVYVLEGKIQNMYFLATAVPQSNRHIDGISLLLYIGCKESKLKMTGGLFVVSKPGEVSSHENIEFVWQNS